jgi:hypothetical protein
MASRLHWTAGRPVGRGPWLQTVDQSAAVSSGLFAKNSGPKLHELSLVETAILVLIEHLNE